MTTGAAAERRASYLEHYLEALGAAVQQPRSGGRPTSLDVASHTVRIDAWEWDALVEWEKSSAGGWRTLVANGLALEARCLADLEDPGEAGADSDLQLDAIVGYKLMLGLQKAVERMVLRGKMDQAKKLTQFRHRVNESVAAVGRQIGDAALREAEALGAASGEFASGEDPHDSGAPRSSAPAAAADPEAEAEVNIRALLELEEKLEHQARADELGTTPPPSSAPGAAPPRASRVPRKVALGATLGVLSLVWLGAIWWPAATRRTLPTFSKVDFASLEPIQDVVARPPSLFVAVDDQKWRVLGEDERHHLVEAVVAIIEPAGYTGVQLTGPGGTLAQWWKTRGIRLNDVSKLGS